MMKRSYYLALAAGLIATLAFSAPCQAASTLVTTTEFFSLTPASATATAADFVYTDGSNNPIATPTAVSILNTGGLSITGMTVTGNDIHFTFAAANHTTGTQGPPPTPGLEFTFMTTNLPNQVFLTNGAPSLTFTGATGITNVAQIQTAGVPEPASFALLGIGMTGFLALRRFFKKTAVA